MNRPYFPLLKVLIVVFLLGFIAAQSPNLFCQAETVEAQALKSFRITPKRQAAFIMIGAVYNPNLDYYVILYFDYKYEYPGGPEQTLYSQIFNRKGKKAGPLNRLATLSGTDEFAPEMDIALNEIENEIVVVWSQFVYDEILGIPLSGDGRVVPGVEKVRIKAPEGTGSGLFPKVAWIPNKNQYAVGWTHLDFSNGSDLDSGFYLSVRKPNLKPKLRPTKVRQQSMKNHYYLVTTLLPLDDRIFWGAAQDAAKKMRPVVWFTDYQGEVIDVPRAKWDGSIFPGPKTKGGGQVIADYNPYQDQYLLLWKVSDNRSYRSRTYSDTYFRIMNGDGSFAIKKQRMPKKFRFLEDALAVFNPMNNHFLVVYSEFKNLYREDPYAEFQGGRLWATYVDPYGQLGQPYKPGEAAFPLTDVFIDKQTGMYLDHVVYDPIHNEYLVIFTLVDYQDMYNPSAHIWGTIIKQN